MKCDSQRCDGNVHLTTFGGSPATECPLCDYIQIIPDNMLDYVKDMVNDIRPVVSISKPRYVADYRKSLDCDLYRHYKYEMKTLDEFIAGHRILKTTRMSKGIYSVPVSDPDNKVGYFIK